MKKKWNIKYRLILPIALLGMVALISNLLAVSNIKNVNDNAIVSSCSCKFLPPGFPAAMFVANVDTGSQKLPLIRCRQENSDCSIKAVIAGESCTLADAAAFVFAGP